MRPTRRELLVALILFLVNFAIMAIEMLASRLLFPHFGNTIFTWSTIISIVIAGLFVGYMVGGALANRRQDLFALLSAELCAAGALVLVVPFLCDALLLKGPLGPTLHPPLLICFVIFGLPAACLAAVPPAGVGIFVSDGRGAAAASGIVSALSAAGSIAGTLATTFWLIPHFGVRALFVVGGLALGSLSLLARLSADAPRASHAATSVLFVISLAAGWKAAVRPAAATHVTPIFFKDSQYQLVRVFESTANNRLLRLLMLDSTQEGAMLVQGKDVVFAYTRAYRVFLNAFEQVQPRKLLFIGGGAYTMPVKTAESLPQSHVDVAEIDPVVAEVGRKYFRAGEPANLSTILADGRQAVAAKRSEYDGIFIDAYQGVYIVPFHLTTREFFVAARGALKSDGFLALNVIGRITEREGFVCALTRTMQSVFARVDLYPTQGIGPKAQNIIVVAAPREGTLDRDLMRGTGFSTRLPANGLACRANGLVLTDDHAPAEWLVAKYL